MSDSELDKSEQVPTETPPPERRAASGKSRKAYFIGLIVAGIILFLLGYFIASGRHETPPSTPAEIKEQEPGQKIRYWTCSMHPQIKLPNPGKCPICYMDLVPVYETTHGEEETDGPKLILSKTARELAEVETSPVEYRPLSLTVRVVGKIDYDETKLANVAAWVGGRIDKLYVNYVGEKVSRGDRLTYVYSPELRTAQEEFLIAHRRWQATSETGDTDEITSALSVKDATRKRLELWGILPTQVEELEQTGKTDDHMTIYAPISGTVITREAFEGQYVDTGERLFSIADLSEVWAQLDAYEIDLEWLRLGQTVKFETDVFPGQIFEGRITFIQPILNEMTRTVKVRVSVPNPGERLKPGMYVRAWVDVELDATGQRRAEGKAIRKPLSIPATAALLTGKRGVVYVEERKDDSVSYVGRQVELGPRAGDYYLVRSGLQEGERVVTRGNFKIDSALQIQAKPSMMKPEGGGSPAGHQHGAPTPQPATEQPAKKFKTPAEHQHSAMTDESQTAGALGLPQMQPTLEAYLALSDELASDNAAQAATAIDSLRDALANVNMEGLGGETPTQFMRLLTPIKQAVPDESPKNIDARRKLLEAVSKPMGEYLRSFGHRFNFSLFEIFCPMAFEGKGAAWHQKDRDIRNPYFGQQMLKCGEVRHEFNAAGKGDIR
ncbi:MAG: efflux RND transporter periplasmic adaptor subunit [Candidatus Abyssobacteria bacterium SURF_17]|uniref:Efflux RND transporter periplasmic adaptor subunit n=1 Tax=Candidatus Abyssobacteria bacterium SURF_17 TaxID=2093361 RepID=A0A419ENR4_9BACT|nr:MAG: efflux RND transporter periplasmic adaptor subunit [Candidatus Abyssubacteria bacterium SURF_17]